MAILPGISRSGTTIVMALLLGVAARRAFSFSFLLSIPAILGAATLVFLGSHGREATGGLAGIHVVASLAAFVSGLAALLLLRSAVRAGRLIWFAPYCFALGAIALILLA
jgi:undecaprenyl-diphosphatase